MLAKQPRGKDLSHDLGETHNVAAQHPQVVKQLEAMMDAAHKPHPNWRPQGTPEQ